MVVFSHDVANSRVALQKYHPLVRKRSSSVRRTFQPRPIFWARTRPSSMSFRKVGREILRYLQASPVFNTAWFSNQLFVSTCRRPRLVRRSVLAAFGVFCFFGVVEKRGFWVREGRFQKYNML